MRVLLPIATLCLAGLCRCSLLVNLDGLGNGPRRDASTEPGDGEPAGDADTVVLTGPDVEGAPTDDGSESETDDAGVGPDDARYGDATDDGLGETGSLDAKIDGAADSGADASAPESGSDAATPDAGTDSGTTGGLVVFYHFDETSGATAVDSSGNGHDATMRGATFTAGVRGNAATMSGAGNYVSLPAGIVSTLTSISISLWVRLISAPAHTHLFDFGTGLTTYMFFSQETSGSRFAITAGGASREQQINTVALASSAWQHVVFTLTGSTGLLYINGVQTGQPNMLMTLNPASLGNTTQNWLGRSQDSTDPYLKGQIDEFRIYDRALTASEITRLYVQQL